MSDNPSSLPATPAEVELLPPIEDDLAVLGRLQCSRQLSQDTTGTFWTRWRTGRRSTRPALSQSTRPAVPLGRDWSSDVRASAHKMALAVGDA